MSRQSSKNYLARGFLRGFFQCIVWAMRPGFTAHSIITPGLYRAGYFCVKTFDNVTSSKS